ncbi:MAG: cytochrome d ubiquinol oxidase subunit II [Planctomyces sp.]|nr:cytochrome d ubiquinol oxidase subunit II [Planctomyces sp.]
MGDWPDLWSNLSAGAALVGLIAYALLGGADFGGGVWDLFATGSRKTEQRLAIQKAMGPVWEANHVWLIFVVVLLFTAFPTGYAALGVALFVPFHLALLGIMLRGAAFVFRSYQSRQAEAAVKTSMWGVVFGVASLITPAVLGAAFGVVTEGAIRHMPGGGVELTRPYIWLSPYCLANGFLAVATCGYLAAVYLTNETQGALREDFRWRAILAGTATAAAACLVLLLSRREAPWFFNKLLSGRSLGIVVAGVFCFAASAWAVFTRRYLLSRILSAGEIFLVILGWGVAQHPYLIYPDFELSEVAAPEPTLRFLVLSLPFGAAAILPSLYFLFRIFKTDEVPAE